MIICYCYDILKADESFDEATWVAGESVGEVLQAGNYGDEVIGSC